MKIPPQELISDCDIHCKHRQVSFSPYRIFSTYLKLIIMSHMSFMCVHVKQRVLIRWFFFFFFYVLEVAAFLFSFSFWNLFFEVPILLHRVCSLSISISDRKRDNASGNNIQNKLCQNFLSYEYLCFFIVIFISISCITCPRGTGL